MNSHKSLLAIVGIVVFTTFLSTLAAVVRPESMDPDIHRDDIGAVLQAAASPGFLEINADTEIRGSLKVDGLSINSLTVESDNPGLVLTGNNVTLTVTSNATLDQDLSTSSSPSFTSLTIDTLNLSSSSNQITFNSGGVNGILSWTPTGSTKTITLPDASGEVSVLGQKISNSELENSKVTITAGTNLTSGGDVSLGSSVTLALKDSISLSGTLAVSGATTLSSTLAVSGATTLSSTLAVSGATTLSSTLAVTGATTLNGNVTLGDSTGDTITATGRFSSSLIPSSDSTYDLGTSALKWGALYVNGISSSGQQVLTFVPTGSGVSQGTLYINPASATADYTMLGIAINGTEVTRLDADGDITTTGDLSLNGGDLTTTATTGTLFNTTATTLSLGGAATTLNLGTTNSVTRTLNLGTGTGADSINIGTGATTADTITLGNTAVASTLTFNSGTTTGTSFTNTLNSLTTGTGLAINSSSLTTGSLLNLSNTNSTSTGSNISIANSGTGPAINYSTTPISAGATGSYTTNTSLPQKLNYHSSTAYNGYLFITGGSSTSGSSGDQSTVYSAQIKADGTLGSFSTLTYLPRVLEAHSSSIYNGYLFVTGGLSSAVQSTVYSASISSTGTLGAFSTLTYLPQATRHHSSATYNGYLFVAGGHNGSTTQSTVYSAPINSDGTIGSFSTLTYLPGVRSLHSALIYNGYLILSGGTNNFGSSGIQSTVYSAPIKADGTIGSWSTLTYLPQRLMEHSSSVFNGYLYIIGGQDQSGGFQSTVYSAPINSDGSIGAFSTLTYLPTARTPSTTAYNGYLFVLGGASDSFSGGNSTVYSAPLQSTALAVNSSTALPSGNLLDLWNNEISKFNIDYQGNVTTQGKYISNIVPQGDGTTGSYATTIFMPLALRGYGATTANGYLFLISGHNGSAHQSTVYSAPIRNDGSTGTYSTLTYFPQALISLSSSTYNGYLYTTGGTNGTSSQSTVYSSRINADGTIGAFSTLTYLPIKIDSHSTNTYNGYLFVTGGVNTAGQSTVYSAPIKSDGTIGNFATLTYLPLALRTHSSTIYNGYLFVVGGTNGSRQSTVYSSPINSDGTIGTFSTLTYLPQAIQDISAVSYNGYLYITGGFSNATQSTVYSAPIKSDGTIGSFSTLNYLPGVRYVHSAIAYNGYLLIPGGCSATSCTAANHQSTVYYTSLTTSRAFAFNANSQDWPESTAGGGSAVLFTVQNNGFERLVLDAQGNLRVTGNLEAQSITSSNPINAISGIVAAGDIITSGDGIFDGDVVVGGSTSRTETLANAGFSIGGDDLFVAGSAGIEGNVYTDGSFIVGATTTYGDGSITQGTSTTFNLLNTVTTTLNIGGAATTVSLGASTGTTTINNNLSVTGTLSSSGQCVTGDTKLRRRRKRKRHSELDSESMDSGSESGMTDDEWEDIRIDQIKPGDEILTLDEETGEFVVSRVNQLMDMGVKMTFELITESGKKIRTTANHPYLVRGEVKTSFVESNVHQKNYYHQQAKSNTHFDINISNQITKFFTVHKTPNNLLSWVATNNATIAKDILYVNNHQLAFAGLLPTLGMINAPTNQPADRLISQSAMADKKNWSIHPSISQSWVKVSQLKPGVEIATIDGWEKVVGINKVGLEQVWDIEVNNTHNFVGNNIVAHNTTFTGNLAFSPTTTTPQANISNSITPIGVGTTGSYSTLTYLPDARAKLSATSYNGYLFVVGGQDNGSTSQSTVYSAQIKADGTIGAFSTLTYLPGVRDFGSASAYNGYLFVVGGESATLGGTSTVYSASISSTGTIGAFSTLTSLPQELREQSSAAYNGYLFVVGGLNTASAVQSTVYSATINSNGTLGAFSTLTYLPQALRGPSSTTSNGYLFVAGGLTGGTQQSTVYSAQIKADGTIGAFSTLTYLPAALSALSTTVNNGYLYVVAGNTGSTQSTVYSALISSNGTIGAFSTLTYLPAARREHSAIASSGYLFVLGGGTTASNAFSTVYSAPLQSTALAINTSSNFAQGNLLDLWNAGLSKFNVNYQGDITTQGKYISNIVPQGDGTTGSYTSTTYLPDRLITPSVTTANGYLYVIGGENAANLSTVYYALIKSDGTVGSYTTTTFLPQTLSRSSAATYNGYLFITGGTGAAVQSTTYSSRINSDGTIGSFSTLTYLPGTRRSHSSTIYNGYLFVVGGNTDGSLANNQSTIYSAPIKSDGTLGSFSTLTYLPQRLSVGNGSSNWSIAYNGYLFVVGGDNESGSDQSTVYSAPIKSDGTLGSFSTLTYLPNTVTDETIIAYNGYLFVAGGFVAGSRQSTVYSAPIKSDGTIGSFSTLTYLPVALTGHGATSYNGYLFVVGGQSGVGLANYRSTTYYAQLTTSRAFAFNANSQDWPESTAGGGSAVLFTVQNNGFERLVLDAQGNLRVTGNLEAQSITSSNPINAISGIVAAGDIITSGDGIFDGDVVVGGSTSRTETLSNSGFSIGGDDLFVAGSAGIEGNVYTDGSFITGATTTYGDGSITQGTSTTFNLLNTVTTTLNIGGAATTVSLGASTGTTTINNNLSVTGTLSSSGSSTFTGAITLSPTSTTPQANISNSVTPIAAGATGSYSTLTYMPQKLSQLGATTYNGYLFVAGGSTGSSQSTVYSAQIKANGTLGSFTTLTYLPQAFSYHGITAYNGYMFIAGGSAGGGAQSTVYSASISSTGTLGSFSTLTYLPQAITYLASTSYNGYLFLVGGENPGGTVLNKVYSAPINSDGTIGAFATLTNLPQNLQNHATIATNGYLIVAGGCQAVPCTTAGQSTVYSAPIKSDGTIGSFSTLTYLPQVLSDLSITSYNGYLFVVAGCTGAGGTGCSGATSQSTVYSAQINSNGTIGSFSTLTYLPIQSYFGAATVANGYIFSLGGLDNADGRLSTVYSAPLQSTALAINTSSSFAQGNLLDLWNNGLSKFNVNYAGDITTQGKYISDIVPQGDGTTGSYSTLTYLPGALQSHSAIAYNSYLFVTGGTAGASTPIQSTVYSAPIRNDGTIGVYSTLTYLPQVLKYLAAEAYNGYLFVTGGCAAADCTAYQSTVYSAPIKSDGTIGSFSTLTYLPGARVQHSATAYNGYLYVVGGYNGGIQSTVYSAKINSDGTTGTYSTLTYLPDDRYLHSATAYNGYLYVVGGINPSNTSTVYSAVINSDGTIGTFSTLTYLPLALAQTSATAYNGYLYVVAGSNSTDGTGSQSTVYSAPIKADGTIGSFSTLTYLPDRRYNHSSALSNGYLFVTGGQNSANAVQSTTYSASLTTSRAFVFNANSQTWPESTGLGGSAAIFDVQNNGDTLATLNAQGDLLLRGKLSANSVVIGTDKPGDLAENMEVGDSSIEAGDIVSIGNSDTSLLDNSLNENEQTSPRANESTNGLVKSSTPYQNNIIGVISTAPSITLSPDLKNSRPVALSGRVPVKVSSENGPINVGDFLTSSSIPGVAMKATRPGVTVGKALEAFSANTSGVGFDSPEVSGDCGKGYKCSSIMIFVTTTYADPNNFLSSLTLDNEGNLIIPKIKTGSLTIDPSIVIPASSVIPAQAGIYTNGSLISGASLSFGNVKSGMTMEGKLLSLEDRLKSLEAVLATSSASLANSHSEFISESSNSGILKPVQDDSTPSATLADTSKVSLGLTSPETLFATGSAQLASVNVENLSSSKLIQGLDLSVSNIFKALGDSYLSNTTIAGELTIGGTLTINSDTINSIGTLYLQNSPLSTSLDIFNGKVLIDANGGLTVQTIQAEEYQAGPKVLGTGTILKDTKEVKIPTTLVKPNSKILVTPSKDTTFNLSVVEKIEGIEFKVSIPLPTPEDLTFNWFVINEAQE